MPTATSTCPQRRYGGDHAGGSTDNETVSYCLTEGVYYVIVWSVDGNINNAYDMTITLGECCLDDPRERPGDDARAEATRANAGDEFEDGQICTDDVDWFVIDLAQGDALTVSVLFDHDRPEDDLDIFLEDPMELTVASGVSFNSDEEITYTAVETGPHYLRVLGLWGRRRYHIGFDVEPFSP